MPGMRRRLRFHGLKRPKIRQDMNKYNLYNLSRLSLPNAANFTYFQQKWKAKAATRAYHGEQVREKQWTRMFSRTAHAVVPMDPEQLARSDGSEMAAGRGSGLQPDPSERPKMPARTPYMQMTYHPTERRLDTAIFRALFASSARQARQFVTHGHVKVNGKEMLYPGYLLNPGDMFQVEPERVLFATGAGKDTDGSSSADDQDETSSPNLNRAVQRVEDDEQEGSDEGLEAETEDDAIFEQEISNDDPAAATRKKLKSLGARVSDLMDQNLRSNKQKQELRALKKAIKVAMSRAGSTTPSDMDDLEAQLQSLSSAIHDPPSSPAKSANNEKTPTSNEADKFDINSPAMQAAIQKALDNPIDESKSYATPWRPRDFMSAFAFIPRYLEVNQNICSAVYLRHPVCMPGFAEVPTPFHHETSQLAFNWYLRRR